jgi:hypothetical protein
MEEIICITSKNEMTEGLFGMVILFMIETLPIIENLKIDVSKLKWNISTKNYGDIFPYILEYNGEYVNPMNLEEIYH